MAKLGINMQIFMGIILGLIVGLLLKEYALLLEPIGTLFLNLLKMVVMPLVFTSIVVGVVNLGTMHNMGKMGLWTAVLFISTSLIAVMIGVLVASIFVPGIGTNLNVDSTVVDHLTTSSFSELVTEIVPKNVMASMAQGRILPIIFFAFFLGAALLSIGQKGTTFIKVFEDFNDAILKMVLWIMKLAPIGVFALIASLVGKTGLDVFQPLAFYMLIVLLGLGIHALIVLPLILGIFGKYSALKLFREMSPALAMAFSTNSSIATLPITMDSLKKKVGLPSRVVSFICPIGATVNMDGTAIYQAIASLFIAQIYGIEFTLMQLAIIVFTTVLASIGVAGIPSSGLIALVIILNVMGIPVEGIGLILAVDRILDMFRTTLNVYTDSVATVIISRLNT